MANVADLPHPFVSSVHGSGCVVCGASQSFYLHDDPIADGPERSIDGWHETMVVVDSPPDGDSKLRRWWTDSAFDEADRTIAKMEEYGSGDLVALGQTLRRMSNRPPLPVIEAMQLGCLMYMLGKIERAVEAVAADRQVKPDTWFDLGVYSKMAQAAQAGVWEIKLP